ncbi:30S ribosomal protein S27ae [Candidatus Micrarchaeota archaeon]|nr:30S ribosomal protein S27ae [Candidatus Micrarchaeota archaeon]
MAEKKKERQTKAFVEKKSCPKCGGGTHLADHANRLYCGKCKYTEMKKTK